MNAEKRIQNSLMSLLKEKPLSKISINDICEDAAVSRSTFYKHYTDKDNVADTVFKQDTIYALNELLKILPVTNAQFDKLTHEWFFQRFYDHRIFYKQLMAEQGSGWFLQLFTDECIKITKQYTAEIAGNFTPIMYEYTCYYLASSQAMLLKKWLLEDCPIPPKELAEAYYDWSSSYWRRKLEQKETV